MNVIFSIFGTEMFLISCYLLKIAQLTHIIWPEFERLKKFKAKLMCDGCLCVFHTNFKSEHLTYFKRQ